MRNAALVPVLLVLFLFPFSIPGNAYAHGSLYFEFAPDTSAPFQTAYYDTPAQRFHPPNDFLGGFDLWLSNSGSPGSATFQLTTPAGTILATKTVTIPTIAPVYGGTKFHVDFPSQPAVSVSKLYHLAVLTDLPNLILYEESQFQILQHNTQGYPYYAIESAIIGTSPAAFAFKFALYEEQESSPPIISNASTTNTSPWGTTVGFIANEPVDFSISYAPPGGSTITVPYTGSFTICTEFSAQCIGHLAVSPSTSYAYTISAKDEWGNVGTMSGSFVSDAAPVAPGEPPPPPVGPPPGSPPPSTPPTTPPPTPPPPGPPVTPPTAPPPVTPPSAPPATPGATPPLAPPASGDAGAFPVPTPDHPVVAGTIFDEQGKPALIISWLAPDGPAPDLYHVEIYDESDTLVTEFDVAGDVHTVKIVERLSQGRYRIRVYAERDGVRTLIGDPIDIIITNPYSQLPPFDIKRVSFVLALIGILGAAGALGVVSLMRRAKARRAAEEERPRGFNLGK